MSSFNRILCCDLTPLNDAYDDDVRDAAVDHHTQDKVLAVALADLDIPDRVLVAAVAARIQLHLYPSDLANARNHV